MANIRLEQLTKNYKRGSEIIRALDGVTLVIEKGEFVAVVGRSGSGKTTMLDLLGLLLKPTSGSLFIDDVDTAKLGDRDRAQMRARRIGFVFQEYNLLSGMNVLENVMLPLRYVKDGQAGKQRARQGPRPAALAHLAARRARGQEAAAADPGTAGALGPPGSAGRHRAVR